MCSVRGDYARAEDDECLAHLPQNDSERAGVTVYSLAFARQPVVLGFPHELLFA
jgi:hypothetical protein